MLWDFRVSFLKKAREKESEDYERQLEVSNRTYGNMEQRLTSEIKLLRKSYKKMLNSNNTNSLFLMDEQRGNWRLWKNFEFRKISLKLKLKRLTTV